MAGAALGVALLLGACSGGGSGNRASDSGENAAAAPKLSAPTAAPSAAGPAASAPSPGGTAAPGAQAPAVGDRKLVLTAEVRLEADNPDAAAAGARSLAIGMGGMVAGEETRRVPVPPYPTTADPAAPTRYSVTSTLTLKIPPAQFDRAIDELSALGTVVARNRTATDVTEQVVDVASRVETQRRSVDRVRQLLAEAASIQEIISLEAELTEREAELDSLLGRQQALTGQVDLATIALTVTSPAPGATDKGDTADKKDEDKDDSFGGPIVDALKGGWDAFVATLRFLLAVTAAVLPFAVVAVVLWLVLRRFDNPLSRTSARRRATRAGDGGPGGPDAPVQAPRESADPPLPPAPPV
ncbi:MAG TPA: DUF4349 domain-containing protein [Yinghuangia sp.]|uniref:DUF4349 domain-containing protein n=1 Tax=Yinghuangia sp. YIM S10712 TaxID=3436930 RepID=UPI002B7AC08D|nr:DUF4349 domain-containing protein [Yinghuangia sp.]